MIKQEEFDKVISSANKQQIEAINHIEGPVLVIAGPGTGKTQILSLRIGKILQETDVFPHNILCLTYTDAGTVAMRKRLLSMIGSDAYRIHIHTFHSFCNTVIQENPGFLGGIMDLQPASDLETVEMFYKLMENFPADNCLKKYTGDIYFNFYRLKALYDTLKKENLDPESLMKKADAYVNSLPDNPDYIYKRPNAAQNIKKGDPNMRLIKAETDKMEDLKAALCEFSNYQKLMAESKRYDFYDMINWVIDAFKNHDGLLAKYQEKYLYFLVDEFQDTNGSQIEILNQLTNFWEAPNLFAVGDDDQSIYSFQGAENERIKDFVQKYKQDLYPVVLSTNYRSTQEILDVSQSLIENNQTRLIYDSTLKHIFQDRKRDLNKNLSAYFKERKGILAVREYYNSYHEVADVLQQIEVLIRKGENLHDTAIIYRSHKQVEDLIKAFDHKKTPYNARLKLNILTLPFVKKLIVIFQYLNLETRLTDSGAHLLFEIMHFDFFDISPRDIVIISREAYKTKTPWLRIISDKQLMFKLGLESASAISELEDLLSYWQKEMHNVTLQVLFEKIITKGGVIRYVMNSPEKLWFLRVLTVFFNFIKTESAKSPKLNLKMLLEMIARMEKNKISIALDKIVYATNGVNLVTAHSSKGLEYKNVYLISCTADAWESRKVSSSSFKLPPLDDKPHLQETEEVRMVEEERRLFYVAMTRARENLYISYPAMKISDNDPERATLEKSRFVVEILEKNPIEIQKIIKPDNELLEFALLSITDAPPPEIKELEKAYIDEVLKNYRLSVTHLNKYLRCKLSFYFENILSVPTARSANMGFGNAMHFALEQLFKKMLENKHVFPSKEEFYGFFNKGMNQYASHFTQEEFTLKKEYGEQLLPAYYDYYVQRWHKVVITEYRLSNVVMENIPISGALDKLEFDGNNVNVIDYKTGNPDDAKTKARLKRPNPDADPVTGRFEEIYGGDYWRQVVFYKILMDNDLSRKWEMLSGEIDFVQQTKKDTFDKIKFWITKEDLEIVKNQVKYAYEGIMAHDFYTGCGKQDCSWCQFAKEYYKAEIMDDDQDKEEMILGEL